MGSEALRRATGSGSPRPCGSPHARPPPADYASHGALRWERRLRVRRPTGTDPSRLPEWRFCFRAEVKRSRGERRGLPGCGAALRPAASARRGWTRTGCPLWAPALTSPRYGLRWPGGPQLSRFLPRRRLRWPWCWESPVSRPLPPPPHSAARPDHGLAGPPRGPRGQPGRGELLVGAMCGGLPSYRRPSARGGGGGAGGPGGSARLQLRFRESGSNVFQRPFAPSSVITLYLRAKPFQSENHEADPMQSCLFMSFNDAKTFF